MFWGDGMSKNTFFIIKGFFVILLLSFCQPVFAAGTEWMDYAVVLQSTGSDEKDEAVLEGARRKLAEEALAFLGTPYVWGGEGKKGYDCSGFIKAVYGRFGIALPRVSIDQGKAGAPVHLRLGALKTGDLIYFRTSKDYPHHVGMYLGHGRFVHSASKRGVVVDDFFTSPLRDAVRSISRIVFTQAQIRDIYSRVHGLSAGNGR